MKHTSHPNERSAGAVPPEELESTAVRVSLVSIAGNTALTVMKLLAGILARSGAMVSDAVHSASDVFSSFIVIIGVKLSAREADQDHPYGHERLECVAALLLAFILLVTGLLIGYKAVVSLLHGGGTEADVPGLAALIAAVISILGKEIMFRYTRKAAKQVDSGALMADAWHHRSDALSSVGALVGIAGARLGLPVLDPVASLVICLFIAKAAYEIFRDAINKMVDESADEETETALRACAMAHPGVLGVDRLMTRIFGNRMYVEMEISVDGAMSLTAAHEIAEGVHNDIEQKFPKVKHIMIHVNPAEEKKP